MKEETKNGDESYTERNKNLPIDRGWAWVILFASFAEAFFLIGTHTSFGIFFVQFMRKFNASASSITVALSVQTITLSIFSLIILSLGSRLCSNRVYIMLAGFSGCCSYILNAFAPNVSFLILSQGFFFGMTHALAHGSTLVVLGSYFEKKRGLATLLANVGASVGSLAFPPFIQYLLDEFDLQGTLIIVAGMLLNFNVVGALMRPLSFYKTNYTRASNNIVKDVVKPKSRELQMLLEKENIPTNGNQNQSNYLEIPEKKSTKPLITIDNFDELQFELIVPEPRERAYTSGTTDRPANYKENRMFGSARSLNVKHIHLNVDSLSLASSTGDIVGSMYSLHSHDFGLHHKAETDADKMETPGASLCCQQMSGVSIKEILSNLINCNVVKNKLFQMYIPVAFFGIVGTAQLLTYIPPHASDLGISKTNTALLITISGATDLASKFILAFIADCHVCKKHQLMALALILSGIVTNLIPFYTDFESMIILSVGHGAFGGLYFGLFPAVLADFVGISLLSGALGVTLLIHGISLSIAAPILGIIRDTTGSFLGSFHLMGSCMLVSGAILLTEPIFRRLEEKRKKSMG